ncbi:polyamine-modulated factor 1-binding protein 1 isoform X1 [Nematostella vectensis]|uniref:polyamine-modulated factor 1-binding protein 1 isoform X1 n=1 Tax=Nematostella vectensis TaxID=45351 RepID=UPI00207737BC|nr:polyamine-modulated factor 1-binding protein 1 isoform X1 [Nematostella vectensis]
MSVLNDLFSQILHSEEKTRERFSKLRTVNNEIRACQLQIREVQADLNSLAETLRVKTHRLAEEEREVNWLKVRENVLKEKQKQLHDKNVEIETALKRVMESSDNERDAFTCQVSNFLKFHDLTGQGKRKREDEDSSKLKQMRLEETRLRMNLKNLQTQQGEVGLLVKKNKVLAEAEENLSRTINVLEKTLEKEYKTTEMLEKEKAAAGSRLQSDAEFRRLSAELEAARDGSMEGICEALSEELKELQQLLLKQELQRQKKQQEQQHKPERSDTRRSFKESMRNRGRTWRYNLNRSLGDGEQQKIDNIQMEIKDEDLIDLSP